MWLCRRNTWELLVFASVWIFFDVPSITGFNEFRYVWIDPRSLIGGYQSIAAAAAAAASVLARQLVNLALHCIWLDKCVYPSVDLPILLASCWVHTEAWLQPPFDWWTMSYDSVIAVWIVLRLTYIYMTYICIHIKRVNDVHGVLFTRVFTRCFMLC